MDYKKKTMDEVSREQKRLWYNDFYRAGGWQGRRGDKFYINYLLQRYDIKQKRVLDVGCGNGRMSKYLTQYSNNVVGIDNSFEAIRAGDSLQSDVEFITTDLLKFEYPDKFDCLFICNFSLFNTYNLKHKLIPKLINVLREGGLIIFIYSTNGSGNNVHNWIRFNHKHLKKLFSLYNSELILEEEYFLKSALLSIIPVPSFARYIGKLLYYTHLRSAEYHLILRKAKP